MRNFAYAHQRLDKRGKGDASVGGDCEKNKGIYAYNCVTRNLKSIIEGNDVYKLESLEDGVLVYDGKSINISI